METQWIRTECEKVYSVRIHCCCIFFRSQFALGENIKIHNCNAMILSNTAN